VVTEAAALDVVAYYAWCPGQHQLRRQAPLRLQRAPAAIPARLPLLARRGLTFTMKVGAPRCLPLLAEL